jgi:ATP-dependent exoDNAse (exonuclease V) alpha subunit
MDNIDLSQDFKATLDEMENGEDCLFITGKAGTGKSTLLKYFCKHSKKKVVVLAPTGIAALNIGGQTIHSFFGLPPRPLSKAEIKPRNNDKVYKALDIIIIDEISMVRADLMDTIDFFMRINGRDRYKPFGGARVIFFGDLFQLPPVVASPEEHLILQQNYESPYFFSAKIFEEFPITMIELREVYRQTDRHFIRLLDSVRTGAMDYDEFMELNERHIADFPTDSEFYIILSARNATVNEINKSRLESLKSDEYSYLPQVSGEINVEPVESPLRLKLGAQVMFLKNDPKRRFANGTIGKVCYLDNEEIKVQILRPDGTLKTIDVERHEWEVIKYQLGTEGLDAKAVGSYKQFPLKLAWAMTIHKSQGKTFDRVIIDMKGGAFETGQTYVALSRCRTLEGIVLRSPLQSRDILIDPRILDFYQQHF